MTVLFLTRHGSAVASCRHRVLQFLPYLRQAGIDCVVSPFFDNAYSDVYRRTGRKSPIGIARGFIRRLKALTGARHFDLVVAHSEVLPFVPSWLERRLLRGSVPLVLDYDDAFFHQYDQHRVGAVRWLLGAKIAHLARAARLVIAGSEYLAEYARRQGAWVEVIPTTVDVTRYPSAPPGSADRVFTLGWIGSPSTTAHLEYVLPELQSAAMHHRFTLLAIGARPFDAPGLTVERVEWREDTEVAELSRCDVGIMPLPDSPWNRGKCGFKLIQAMACWKPVIASPVGANTTIVTEQCGILAGSGGWAPAIARLRADSVLRAGMGRAGRGRVEQSFSLQAWAPRIIQVIRQAASR